MTGLTGKPSRAFKGIGVGVGVAISIYGYIAAWPAWGELLALLAVPSAAFTAWMYTGRLKRYRFLFGIYAVVSLLAVYEAWQYKHIPESFAESIDLPRGPGKPNLNFDYDLPDVMLELFPDYPDTLFLGGIQSQLCSIADQFNRQHPFCQKYDDSEIKTTRDWFETALAKKPKMNQDLYYHYVEILVKSGAPQSEINAAVEEWKRMFPLSERPDPGRFFAEPAKSPN